MHQQFSFFGRMCQHLILSCVPWCEIFGCHEMPVLFKFPNTIKKCVIMWNMISPVIDLPQNSSTLQPWMLVLFDCEFPNHLKCVIYVEHDWPFTDLKKQHKTRKTIVSVTTAPQCLCIQSGDQEQEIFGLGWFFEKWSRLWHHYWQYVVLKWDIWS